MSRSEGCSPCCWGCGAATSATSSVGSSACTSEIVNGRMPRMAPPSSLVTRVRLYWGPETYAALNRSSVDWSGLR